MSFRPVASVEAGMHTGAYRSTSIRRRVLLIPTLALSTLVIASPGFADQAQDILKKMGDVYKNAKSFDGTITAKQAGKNREGKAGSLTTTQHVRFLAPNLFSVELKAASSGAVPALRNSSESIFCDGKTCYVYTPSKQTYYKSNVPPAIQLPQLLQLLRIGVIPGVPAVPGASLATPTTVQGRAAYVVQVKPQMRQPNPGVKTDIPPFFFYVDKQNYHLLKFSQKSKDGGVEIEFANQTLNGTLAASSFAFKVPAGAKEVSPPAPQMPGGMRAPGAPPR